MVNVDEKNIPSEWYLLRTGNVQLTIVIPLINTDIVIGRNTNLHLRLSSHVSRKHAKLHKTRNGVWYIYDLKSTCGLYINKMKVKPEEYVRINDGDIIGLGVSDVTSETDFEFILCRKLYNIRPNRSQTILNSDVYNKFSLQVKKHKNESLKLSKYKRIKLCSSDSDEETVEYTNLAISIKSKVNNTVNKTKINLENNFQPSECSSLELKNENFGNENDKINMLLKRNKITDNHNGNIDINNSDSELRDNVNQGDNILKEQNTTELDHNYVLKKHSKSKINSKKYLNSIKSGKSESTQVSNFLLENKNNKPNLKVNESIYNISKTKMSQHDFLKIRIKRILQINKKTNINFGRKRSKIIKNNETINDGNSLTKKQPSSTQYDAISSKSNEERLLTENKDLQCNFFDRKEYMTDSEKNKTEMKSSQDLEESQNKPSTININSVSELMNKLSDGKKEETSEFAEIDKISKNSQAYNGVGSFPSDGNFAVPIGDNNINNSSEVIDEYSENFLSSEYFSNALNFFKINYSSNIMDNIIAVILYLNKEKSNFKNYSDHCKKISLCYNSYEEYFNTYFPLLMFDLLEYICQSIIREGNSSIIAMITGSSITELLCIKCKILNNKNLNIDDLICIQIITRPQTDTETKYEYGYVAECVQEDFQSKNHKDSLYKLYIIKLLKHNSLILSQGTYIKIISVCNIFSFAQQFEALIFIKESQFLKSILEPNNEFCKIITNPDIEIISSDKYISCQVDAIKNISNTLIESNNCILMLQTPPGTGKCHTVVGIIQQILFQSNHKMRILILSLRETEIEEIGTKLYNLDNENIRQIFIGNCKGYFSSKGSKSFYLEETIKRNLNKMPSGIAKNPDLIYNLRKEIIANANIILTLFNSLNCDFVDFNTFNYCFVYEATLCTELQTLIPLKYGINKLLLIGDPQQSSALTWSKICYDCDFHISLFERFNKFFEQSTASSPAVMLSRQYRIHPDIISFPSRYFYSNRLKSVNISNDLPILPYCIIDLIDVKTDDNVILEIKFITELLNGISNILTQDKTIAIFTKYIYQKNQIKNILNEKNNCNHLIAVYTFKEQRIYITYDVAVILYSAPHEENDKTLNILLTRAKSSLILCGYFTSLQNHSFWDELLKDAKKRHVLFKFPPSCGNLACESLRRK